MSNRIDVSKKNWLTTLLVSMLFFTFLVLSSAAVLLRIGVGLDTITVGRTTLSDFSLIWQERLELQIGTVSIKEHQGETSHSKELTFGGKTFGLIGHVMSLFSKVIIKEIRVGDLTGAIHLLPNAGMEASYISLTSTDLKIRSNIALEQGIFILDITEAVSRRFNSRLTGRLRLDTEKELLTGDLAANISGSLPINVEVMADRKKISFLGKEAGEIRTITPLVDMFGLSHNIQRWVTDYLRGSRYHLQNFSGTLVWNSMETFLDTLYAEVRVDDCEYTFAPGLEPIKTRYTDVVLEKGLLTIRPHGSTFYGQGAEGSWVEIDFNDPANIILASHITTSAMANDDIVALLNYYKISLPFKQTRGKTATDLVLTINLNTREVDARGTFVIDDGVVEYDRKSFNIQNAAITLENSEITIENITVGFEEKFVANISGVFQAQSGEGDLDIVLEQCNLQLGSSILVLDELETNPTIKYHIRPDGHSVDAGESVWMLNGKKWSLGSFSSPFSAKDLAAVIPSVLLHNLSGVSAEVSGAFSIKDKKAEFQCNLLKFDVKDMVLENPGLQITIEYDQQVIFRTEKTSEWSLNNITTFLYPSELKYGDRVVSITNGRVSYGGFFDSELSGYFDNHLKKGSFSLDNLHVKEKNIGELLGLDESIAVEVSGEKGRVVLSVPEFDLKIRTGTKKNWLATINDLSVIQQRSKLLQRLSVDSGSMTVSLDNDKGTYSFSAEIDYPYPLLIQNKTPVNHFVISGTLADNGFRATVNEDLQLQFTDDLSVSVNNLGINVPAIYNLMRDLSKPGPGGGERARNVAWSLEADNSSFFFKPSSQILADKIHLDSFDGKTTMLLEHGPGSIDIEVDGDVFSIEGKELNDVFMGNLIQGSRFEKGRMSFAAQGTFDNFSALFKINDTILRDMRTFNNVMAFLDTIPALVTFSLPEYNSRGLPISSAVAGLTVTGRLAALETLEVDSPELDMIGTGWIDFSNNLMDMKLNLITGAKSNLSKIPLLGYVMVGQEKKPSITLKISGNLQDPKVENSIFRNVMTMPFSILYRTLHLPFHLVDTMVSSAEKKIDATDTSDFSEKAE